MKKQKKRKRNWLDGTLNWKYTWRICDYTFFYVHIYTKSFWAYQQNTKAQNIRIYTMNGKMFQSRNWNSISIFHRTFSMLYATLTLFLSPCCTIISLSLSPSLCVLCCAMMWCCELPAPETYSIVHLESEIWLPSSLNQWYTKAPCRMVCMSRIHAYMLQ